jgi:hypothetical protein
MIAGVLVRDSWAAWGRHLLGTSIRRNKLNPTNSQAVTWMPKDLFS